jgi:SRSO17 transposase
MTSLPDALPAEALAAELATFHGRFADLFARSEQRTRSQGYLRALLGGAERRNGWQLAEQLHEATPDGTQRLLTGAVWSASAARDRLVALAQERFGAPDGVLIFDETGFLKKGTASAGVGRQYSGTAGKIENCQIGVFAGYVSPRGHLLVDRALYLPADWTTDRARCRRAGIPDRVRFRTKATIAARMHHRLRRLGLATPWVTGDEVYGDSEALRAAIAARGDRYVFAVACKTHVWATPPATAPVGQRGPRRQRVHAAVPSVRVDALLAAQPAGAWQRRAIHQGEHGPITYDWLALRIVEKRDRQPGRAGWLLGRRSVTAPTEHAYYLSNAPPDCPLEHLAHVACSRFVIEQCLHEGKDDLGMDHYEVRRWTAWHRFMTLTMLAMALLATVRQRLAAQTADHAARPAPKGRGPRRARRGPWRRGRSPRPGNS